MLTTEAEDALVQRLRAKSEIERLKKIVEQCDAKILSALNYDDTEFMRWVNQVRGEVADYEHRKVVWTNPTNGDRYTVSKRRGSAPRRTISPEKLLENGVPAYIIQEATVYGEPGKPGISVRRVGGVDPDGEE